MPLVRRLLLLAICGAGVAWLAGPAGRLLVVLPLLLFGPGYLIERWLRPFGSHAQLLSSNAHPNASAPMLVLPLIWLALSLSVVALLYEWATALGVALAPPLLGGLAAGCALAVIIGLWRDQRLVCARTSAFRLRDYGWSLALLAIFALTLWTRFFEIRDLALPAWVDSVHHALMIRLAVERGQAPLSLAPYMPVVQLPYHWGYHVLVAAAIELSGAALPQAMLWSGQLLNALQALAVAGLAAYLWRKPIAPVVAALVVGLISIFPAYYVSWGRYTQLTGLLLLPALMASWLALLRAPAWQKAVLLALLLAGLSLIHFVVLAFALIFMLVSGFVWLWSEAHAGWPTRVLFAGAAAFAALVLAGPWLCLLATRALLPSAVGRSRALVGTGSYFALDQALLWAGPNRLLIVLALLAALWGLRRRRQGVALLLVWVGALLLLASPQLVPYLLPLLGAALLLYGLGRRQRLPLLAGANLLLLNPWTLPALPHFTLVNIEAVVISLFLPIGLLLGGASAWLWDWLDRPEQGSSRQWLRVWRLLRAAALVALAGLALAGAWGLRNVLNQGTVLAKPADLQAIEWAEANTPPDARFLINAVSWINTGRGTDGGWWLLPLAGRWISTPPALYSYGQADYIRATRARTQLVSDFKPGQEAALYQMIDRDQIGYVYLGVNPGPLTAANFPASQGFVQVYAQDGVMIFKVNRPR